MKVVLFCGGYGLPEGGEELPKPMHPVGPRPLLWHVMRYYAHFGHHDFILVSGMAGITSRTSSCTTTRRRPPISCSAGQDVELLGHDVQDWTITFVDTGMESTSVSGCAGYATS